MGSTFSSVHQTNNIERDLEKGTSGANNLNELYNDPASTRCEIEIEELGLEPANSQSTLTDCHSSLPNLPRLTNSSGLVGNIYYGFKNMWGWTDRYEQI